MKHGKVTHNFYVDEKEYLHLKKEYPGDRDWETEPSH